MQKNAPLTLWHYAGAGARKAGVGRRAPARQIGAQEAGTTAGGIMEFAESCPRPRCRSGAAGGGPESVDGGPGPVGGGPGPLSCLTTTSDECSEEIARAPGSACATRATVRAMAEFVRDTPDPGLPVPAGLSADSKIVRAAAARLGCATEACVLESPAFGDFVEARRLATRAGLSSELAARFKIAGPRDSTDLLNDRHIDLTLKRWARTYPEFYPCPYAMIDFARNGDMFGRVDLPALFSGKQTGRAYTCFGCVVNTDVSSGPGKHWVAVFVDARPPPGELWTVEYFNSAGNPPGRAIIDWMERARARLIEYRARPGASPAVISVPVTRVRHQYSRTECGLYALYYIRRRLEGAPFEAFARERIPDQAMTDFRRHCFRS